MNSGENNVVVLAEFLQENPSASDEEIYAGLASAGLTENNAAALFVCTQAAWGRQLAAHTDANFSDELVIANSSGQILSRCKLSTDPYFSAATKIYSRYASSIGCGRFARMSSDFKIVESSINSGKNVKTSKIFPIILFADEVTADGLEKVIKQLRNSSDPCPSANKPWWKFW